MPRPSKGLFPWRSPIWLQSDTITKVVYLSIYLKVTEKGTRSESGRPCFMPNVVSDGPHGALVVHIVILGCESIVK